MPQPGALNFFHADLYPGPSGYFGTSDLSIPGPGDQFALVDDEQLAQQNPVNVDDNDHKKLFFTVAAIIGIIVLFSLK